MKCGILLAAFGSSNPQGEHALRHFDASVRANFPNMPVRWAFTSLQLRERLAAARVKKDSLIKALQKMRFEKYTHVAVQPLQTIPGTEYETVIRDVAHVTAQNTTLRVRVGAPLLSSQEDVHMAALAVIRHTPKARQSHEAVVLMGHGAAHAAVKRYEDLAKAVLALDPHVHVGTMSGAVLLSSILPKLPPRAKVWLMPLLSVVGQHALQDMAGTQGDSWRTCIENAGHVCQPVLRGLAEYSGFADIWLAHLHKTIENLLSAQ